MLRIEYADYRSTPFTTAKRLILTSAAGCCSARTSLTTTRQVINHASGRSSAQEINGTLDSAHNRYNIAPQELVKIQRHSRLPG